MLRALDRLGVSTRVLCLTRGEPFETEITSLGVPVEWIGKSHLRSTRLYRLVRALRQQPPDILQSVHFFTNLYAAVAGRIAGIRAIGAIRNDLTSELIANGIWGRWQLLLPKHLITNSELAQQRAIDRGFSSEQISFLRNAVDTNWLKGNGSSRDGKKIKVLFVGRLEEQKRPHLFLRAVSRAIAQSPVGHVTAIVAGDGPMRRDLESHAKSLGLTGQVDFIGSQGDMASVYKEADLLVMTSKHEGTPNVLLEAMASGLPVVATRVGGIPEIIEDSRGLLVEPEDENGLVAAILKLIGDRNLRLEFRQRGLEYVDHVHSLDALGRQLMCLYQEILS
ncbi:MAG: glycosyltransferase [Pyrinomonadaceae bacterium]|nr:glycosyltransferase [Pyrinomonadaceae bacterium]